MRKRDRERIQNLGQIPFNNVSCNKKVKFIGQKVRQLFAKNDEGERMGRGRRKEKEWGERERERKRE